MNNKVQYNYVRHYIMTYVHVYYSNNFNVKYLWNMRNLRV